MSVPDVTNTVSHWPFLPTLVRLASLIGCLGGLLGNSYALLALTFIGLFICFLNFREWRLHRSLLLTTSAALIIVGFCGVLSGKGHTFTPVATAVITADRENAINIANGDYNKAVPRARGEADQTIRAAEGYRFKRVNEAEGDIAAFSAVLQQYVKAPEITRTRLYLETMSEVLPQMEQKIIVDESLRQLLPILPLSTKPEGRQ